MTGGLETSKLALGDAFGAGFTYSKGRVHILIITRVHR